MKVIQYIHVCIYTCIIHKCSSHDRSKSIIIITTTIITYTSINIDPKGRTPPNITIAHGSINLTSKERNVTLASVCIYMYIQCTSHCTCIMYNVHVYILYCFESVSCTQTHADDKLNDVCCACRRDILNNVS